MAERSVDRLLPRALAVLAGVAAIAFGASGIAAEALVGRPSSTSAIGLVLLVPVVLIAAVVGFAIGYALGGIARRRGFDIDVPVRAYRASLLLASLAVAAAAGWAGASPVWRQERLHAPRVLQDAGSVARRAGAHDDCATLTPATRVCDIVTGQSAQTLAWNSRDVTVGCTRQGRLTLSDDAAGQVTTVDLSAFEYLREVHAGPVRQPDGRAALALLAEMRASGRRAMFIWIDADARIAYQELLERTAGSEHDPLAFCDVDDRAAAIVRVGAPITYQAQ